jgi:hypothetical protein
MSARWSDEKRTAAYREHDEQVGSAWKADPEFGNALKLAITIGVTKPLRDYVKAGKPVPQEHVSVAGEITPMHTLVAALLGEQNQQQKQQQGRPQRVASEAPCKERAERNAAWLVAFAQAYWRECNGRKRVPPTITNKMIEQAIAEAAKALNVPASAIKASNIRNLLKSGRVVVTY